MRRKEIYSLQHKYPWQTVWQDIDEDKKCESERFAKLLRNEPPFIIEMEYRIIKKVVIKIKSKDKNIISHKCCIVGKDMMNLINKYKKENNSNA